MSKKELKKIIYDFNRISNRLLNVNFNDYLVVLKKFLSYIESTNLIWAVIEDAGEPSYDVCEEVQSATGYNSRILELGETEREEIANIYHVLKYCSEKSVNILELAYSYSSSTKYQDKVREFNHRVVLVLINNIEAYLRKVGIDMGLDENTNYNITVNNGQVNLASDNANIHATQNNGVDINELAFLVESIVSHIDDSIATEKRQQIEESLEMIQTELGSTTPKKTMIKMALTGLGAIKGSTEFAAAVAALIQFVNPLI